MKRYSDLTPEQQAQVDADPAVIAAVAAVDAYEDVVIVGDVAYYACAATLAALSIARAAAIARLFGKEESK